MRNFFETIAELNSKIPKHSRLIAIRQCARYISKAGGKYKVYLCRCSCGKTTKVVRGALVGGGIISCGCYRIELLLRRQKYTHVIKEIRGCYDSMMTRCYKIYSREYPNYGGRGVTVCDEWKNNYQNFLTWALANGWQKGLEIDKDSIPDKLDIPALLYSPEMCCFVSSRENKKHRRVAKFVYYNDKKVWLSDLAVAHNVPYQKLYHLIWRGSSPEQALLKLKNINNGKVNETKTAGK